MNITFRQLRVFVEVAQHGSMARAAEALHLTPPAVSMQVKELEAQVGLPLFDRHARAVSLSTAGEYFLVHARRMLAALKDADHAMARFKRLEHGVLTIGIVSTAKYFVPHLLARFQDEHPGIEVRLRVAPNREQLVALMDAGEADLSIMGRPLPAAALADYPLIAREPASGTRNTMNRYFTEQRVQPRIAMEMPSNETIKQAVMAGMGLSFLSLHTLGLELRSGLLHLLDVEGTPVVRAWNVVHLGSKVLSPAAEAFRYFILEHGEAYLLAHDTPLLSPPGRRKPARKRTARR